MSITRVETTGDLRYSKVYISVFGQVNEKELKRGLRSASAWLRRELGASLHLRYTPELIFELDRSIEHGAHISEMISQLDLPPEDPAESDSAAEPDPETLSDAEKESDTETELHTETESDMAAETFTETESGLERESDTETAPETVPNSDAKTDTITASDIEAESDSTAEPYLAAEPFAETEPDLERESAPYTGTGTGTESEAQRKPKEEITAMESAMPFSTEDVDTGRE